MMFLGGRLDHTTRPVIASGIQPDRPAAPRYKAPGKRGEPDDFYQIHRVDIEGRKPWWVYIQEGYAPPREHILHTNPNSD